MSLLIGQPVSHVSGRLYLTAKAVAAWVRERFAVDYTANVMTTLLKRLGLVYKPPKRVWPGRRRKPSWIF